MGGLRTMACTAIWIASAACFSDGGESESGGSGNTGSTSTTAVPTTGSTSNASTTSMPTGSDSGSGTGAAPPWNPTQLWETTRAGIHPNSGDSARGIAILSDGTIIAAGTVNDQLGTSTDAWWANYEATGALLNETVFDVNTEVDIASSIAVDPMSGDAFVAGSFAMGSPNLEPLLERLSLPQFTSAPFGSFTPTPGQYTIRAVVVTEAAVIVAGDVPGLGGMADAFVTAFDFAGMELWTRVVGGPDEDGAHGLAYDEPTRRLVVAATTSPGPGDEDALLLRINTNNGNEEDRDLYAGAADGTDQQALAVAFGDDGIYYVAGADGSGGSGLMAWIRRYNASGAAAWTRTYDAEGVGDAVGLGITVAPGGEVIACGLAASSGDDLDLWMARYARADGAELGVFTADGGQGGADRLDACAVTPSDVLIVGGRVTGLANTDAYLAAYAL